MPLSLRPPVLEELPATMNDRVRRALALLADARWSAETCSMPGDSMAFALRVHELQAIGLTSADCQWLAATGYVAVRPLKGRSRVRRAAFPLVGPPDEGALVWMTHAGEMAFHQAAGHGTSHEQKLAENRDALTIGHTGCLRYDCESRELFLNDSLVLRLSPIARNLHAVLKTFEDHLWSNRIPCPFSDLPSRRRAQHVRDAVHGLNSLQEPNQIAFHSDRKGGRIWYELTEFGLNESGTNSHTECNGSAARRSD